MDLFRKSAAALATLAMLAAASVVVLAAPAAANGDLLWFGQVGNPTGKYGANSPVYIGGKFTFKNSQCPEDGVPDFVYPTSDVYVVVPGTANGHLVDATGGPPNTVIQYGTIFDDEIIGITAPAGKLGAGTYDVVFDTCQDGVFQDDQDTVFSRVLTVEMPDGDLPAPDPALEALKQASYDQYESWKQTRWVVNGVWKLVERALSSGCRAGNPTACALKYGNYFSPIKEQFDGLLLNQGQHYRAIYEDPPNEDFDQPVVAPAVSPSVPGTDAIASEAVLAQTLLRAIEAYKGAQQAGDAEWALVHAREARDLHVALAAAQAATTSQLEALRATFTTEVDPVLDQAYDLGRRFRLSGFTPDERKTLLENGMTGAEVTALEAQARNAGYYPFTSLIVREQFTAQIDAHAATAQALAEGRTAWADIVAALEADVSVVDEQPVADAGGPYAVTEGAALVLDGSASRTATGGAPASFAWDLDGDAQFDDAASATPTVTFDDAGAPVVGLRVGDGEGRTAYAWTTVTVASAGAAPSITTATPNEALVKLTVGTPQAFSVTATDDRGATAVSWLVDGEPAGGAGASLTWTAPDEPGVHTVTAVATDSDGHRVERSWDVLVHAVDGDGDGWTETTDCNDTDAAVYPGQVEFLGNGVDDDCNAGSPDAPLGGLTGTVYGWGSETYGQTGTGLNRGNYQLPTKTVLPENVVQVEMAFGTGFALLDDGTVRAWGTGSNGVIGDGAAQVRITPVQPLGPGGQGTLTGIRQISAHNGHAAAVDSSGRVLTWGRNTVGTLGNGTESGDRHYPDYVLTGPNTPLTGVKQVFTAWNADYALMEDGSVYTWGIGRCDGVNDTNYDLYAKPVPGLTDIRQVAVSMAILLFLKKDGTVLSCGGTDPQLGRPWAFTPEKHPYSPRQVVGLGKGSGIVDISITSDQALALKEDGTVLMWGENTNAGLGPVCGTTACTKYEPVVAPMPAGPQIVDLNNEESVTTFARRVDGSMLVWGGNTYGAGGTGQSGFMPNPTVVPVGNDRVVVQVAGSNWNGLALTRPKDDPALELPAVGVSAGVVDADLTEADGGSFVVTLNRAHSEDVALSYDLIEGSAGAEDVALGSGTVVVPAGATSATIPVPVLDDELDEDAETVTVALTSARLGVTLDRAQATGTITDDDAAPTVSVDPVALAEGDTSLTDVALRLRLSAPSGKEVVARWATSDSTATAGADYVSGAAEVRFAPGQTEHVVHLGVIGDTVVERDESFAVDVTEVEHGTAGSGGAVTIEDDEVLALSTTAATVTEGDTGTTPAQLTLTVAPALPAGLTVEVPWTVTEPDAGNGDTVGDVQAASGTVVLSAAGPSATVTLQVIGDETAEAVEYAGLTLGEPRASDGRLVLAGRSAQVAILDDDVQAPPPAWPFDGFFAPVDNPPVVNVVKAGSAVPIKFSLGGYRGLDIFAEGSPASGRTACGTDPTDVLESTATPGASELTYDPGTDRYHYVWKTAKAWAGTCRQFVLILADGSRHVADFQFR